MEEGEPGLAGSITWSFLGFRCLSPSAGCREVKYPKCLGRGWWHPPGKCLGREEVCAAWAAPPGAVSSPKIIKVGKDLSDTNWG